MVRKIPDFDRSQLQKLRKADGASQAPAWFGVTREGHQVFVKEDVSGTGMLEAEADGLRALSKAAALRVPEIFFQSKEWLVMEAVEREPAGEKFWCALAEGLVRLHQNFGAWGWSRDNFIGRNPQYNRGAQPSWADFFWEQRIVPQIEMLRIRRIWTGTEERWLSKLEEHVKRILASVDEPPSLLHGDLWSGNVLCGRNQIPILIDPAVYYGHREADLAMTELFGGFARSFYQRYKDLWPLAPGYPERRLVYNFYHKLNHANLYGSGYIWDVKKTLLDIVQASENQPPIAEKV
jgi:fructosamine-3-kinase